MLASDPETILGIFWQRRAKSLPKAELKSSELMSLGKEIGRHPLMLIHREKGQEELLEFCVAKR